MSDQVNSLVLLEARSYDYKGLGNLFLGFDPKYTGIVGKNGSGKTSFMNGYVWLLSRKDIWDKTDYEVQYRDKKGIVADEAESAFECVFLHKGRKVKLKRMYYQYWKKNTNGPGKIFDSMRTKYFVNDEVKSTEKEYMEVVSGLLGCDTETFKVVTIPDYLLKMDQTQMRPILLKLVGGDLDEGEIIASNHQKYGHLTEDLAFTPLAKYRTNLEASKKKLDLSVSEKKSAIQENKLKLVKEENWDALDQEKKELRAGVESLVKQIAGLSEGEEFTAHNNRVLERQQLVNKNQTFKLNFENKQATENSKIEAKKIPFQSEINTNNAKIADLEKKNKFDRAQDIIDVAAIESIRKRYYAEEQKQYSGPMPGDERPHDHPDGITCNECHRPFTDQELVDLKELIILGFNNKKAEEMAKIKQEGIDKNNALQKIRQDVINRESEIVNLQEKNTVLQAEIDKIKKDDSKAEDQKEYKKTVKEIEALDKLIADPPKVKDEELQTRKSTYEERIEAIDKILPGKKTNQDVNDRDKVLKAELDSINQEIFDLDKKSAVAKDFSHEKSAILQNKINKLFKIVQFQLFDEQNDGTQKEVCWPLLDGVPWTTANTAGQIQMFMDVADTFSRIYNICLPRFVDKKESVTTIPSTNSQVITLSVVPFVPTPMRNDSKEYIQLHKEETARISQLRSKKEQVA